MSSLFNVTDDGSSPSERIKQLESQLNNEEFSWYYFSKFYNFKKENRWRGYLEYTTNANLIKLHNLFIELALNGVEQAPSIISFKYIVYRGKFTRSS